MACLSLPNGSDAEPRSGSTFQQRDAQRRAKRGAEAPGQRTPLRRLLQRVSRRPSRSTGPQRTLSITSKHLFSSRCVRLQTDRMLSNLFYQPTMSGRSVELSTGHLVRLTPDVSPCALIWRLPTKCLSPQTLPPMVSLSRLQTTHVR
jgi:hypothetical protein